MVESISNPTRKGYRQQLESFCTVGVGEIRAVKKIL